MKKGLIEMHEEDEEESPNAVAAAISDVAYQLRMLGCGDALTTMGAIEFHGTKVEEAGAAIERGLNAVASSIERLAEAIQVQ